MNNKCFSWVTAVRVLSLAGSHSPPHLSRMPPNTVLIAGPAVGAAQILIWSYSSVFLPPGSTAVRTGAFLLRERSVTCCVLHGHRVCLVDRVISSEACTAGGKGLGLPEPHAPGFQLWFISTSACGSSTGVCSWGCPGGLGLPLWGPVWRWCSCLGRRGSGRSRSSGGQGSRKYVL